jgi:hypothetical protein
VAGTEDKTKIATGSDEPPKLLLSSQQVIPKAPVLLKAPSPSIDAPDASNIKFPRWKRDKTASSTDDKPVTTAEQRAQDLLLPKPKLPAPPKLPTSDDDVNVQRVRDKPKDPIGTPASVNEHLFDSTMKDDTDDAMTGNKGFVTKGKGGRLIQETTPDDDVTLPPAPEILAMQRQYGSYMNKIKHGNVKPTEQELAMINMLSQALGPRMRTYSATTGNVPPWPTSDTDDKDNQLPNYSKGGSSASKGKSFPTGKGKYTQPAPDYVLEGDAQLGCTGRYVLKGSGPIHDPEYTVLFDEGLWEIYSDLPRLVLTENMVPDVEGDTKEQVAKFMIKDHTRHMDAYILEKYFNNNADKRFEVSAQLWTKKIY